MLAVPNGAAHAGAKLSRSFLNVQFALLVGVGSGVMVSTRAGRLSKCPTFDALLIGSWCYTIRS